MSLSECCAAEYWPEAEDRTERELAAAGLRVETVVGQAVTERQRRIELGDVARNRGAACAVRIVRPSDGPASDVEIWISDQITGKTLFREFSLVAGQDRDQATLAALRATEALRASLIEAALPQSPTTVQELPTELQPLAAVPATVSTVTEPNPWGIGVHGGGLLSPGGVEPSAALAVDVRWRGVPGLVILGEGLVTVYSDGIESNGIQSSFNLATLRLMLAKEGVFFGKLRALAGVGAGLAIPWSTGNGPPDVLPTTAQTALFNLGSTVRLGWDVGAYTTLWVGADVDLLVPGLRLQYGDQLIARFGRPTVRATVGLEVRLPGTTTD